ncbi:uncharacterized protein LOC111604771 isoform X2 [Drosophila hydei]|nr:uncharacterized protein LOC111604771 isoform X2 [Drosophila hydei]XP_023178740.1 uncharacterized protein LOC111604771 isoform X2 [Drosophila hydei]
MCYAFPIAAIYLPFAAYLLAPLDRIMFTLYKLNWRAWRLSMFINLIPGILSIIILVFLPESAKFLLFVGKDKLAYETVDRLYKLKRKRDLASIGITAINDPDSPVKLKEKSNCCIEIWRDTVPLFKRPYVANFMICSIILCGILFVGTGISLWFMELRQLMGNTHMTVCQMLQENKSDIGNTKHDCPSRTSILIDCIFLGGTFLSCCILLSLFLLFMQHYQILFLFTTIATVCGLCLNFLSSQVPILVATALFTTMCTSCIPLISSVLLDLMPTHIRGMAISMAFLFARLAVILANILLGFCMVSSCLLTFNIFVAVTLMVVILTCLLPK